MAASRAARRSAPRARTARVGPPAIPEGTFTFTCFRKLPLELRCAIWKATLLPRVIELVYDLHDGFFSMDILPLALSVCRESREAVLPSYPLCFGTIFYPAKTRFNFELDTLYVDNSSEQDVPHLFATLGEKERKGLRYIAVDNYLTTDDDIEMEFVVLLRKAMRQLEGLAELQIVFDINHLAGRVFGCGEDNHTMELYEELPADLASPELSTAIGALPDIVDFESDLWKVRKVKPVYGWRRCPGGVDGDGF